MTAPVGHHAPAPAADWSADEVRRAAAELEGAPAEAIAGFALAAYPRLALSTAFGPEGCALVHLCSALRPGVTVFTVDTGLLFPESVALRQAFAARYPIRLQVVEPALSLVEQERLHGASLHRRDPERCCGLRKVEPTARVLAGLDAWVAGLRRDQSPGRAAIAVLERYLHADGTPLIKVNPLARWSRADTWRYLVDHQVPYNPLLDEGYRSIGCRPCTRRVSDDEPERAGRWDGRKDECGIHTFLDRQA